MNEHPHNNHRDEDVLSPALRQMPLPPMALGGWISDYSPATLDRMRALGMTWVADCIGVQSVEGVVPPDQASSDPRGNEGTRYLPTMIERAAAPFADSELPLCFTAQEQAE
jgi:hypothetical protein